MSTEAPVDDCGGGLISPPDAEFYIYLFVSVALIFLSGLFSGLTLGMLSLDDLALGVLQKVGQPWEKKNAEKILPLLKNKNQLLVTLVLCNSIVALTLPLTLDRIVPAVIAVVISVTGILLFGEVFPQAICAKHGLAIGAFFSPMVRVIYVVVYPIAWPIAKLLDILLGANDAAYFRRAELAEFVKLHKEEHDNNEDPLRDDEIKVIQGALEMRDKVTGDAMTPIEKVFALPRNAKLSSDVMDEIVRRGHSRVPVYNNKKEEIDGYVMVKSLIKFDPVACAPLSLARIRKIEPVDYNLPMFDLLHFFMQKHVHLGSVQKDGETVGIITLEDVLEELIRDEIVDETDVFVDVARGVKVAKAIRLFHGREVSMRENKEDGSFELVPVPTPLSPTSRVMKTAAAAATRLRVPSHRNDASSSSTTTAAQPSAKKDYEVVSVVV